MEFATMQQVGGNWPGFDTKFTKRHNFWGPRFVSFIEKEQNQHAPARKTRRLRRKMTKKPTSGKL